MRAICLAIGRLKAGPERDLVKRYAERLSSTGRIAGFSGIDLIELPESRATDSATRKQDEAERLLQKIPENAFIVAFDERGKAMDSVQFANIVKRAADNARPLVTVLGGPDGFASSFREKADHVVAFGKLTMPHQIVRGLVLEQLYRATTILAGHPYHRV